MGHLRVAEDIRQQLTLQHICFIPCGTPPHRANDLMPGEHRTAMLQLAIEDNPHFILDDCEIRRSGPSYMIDTLKASAVNPLQPRCLIIGSDAFSQFHTWKNWQAILDHAHLVVMARPKSRLLIPSTLEDWGKNRIIERFAAVHESPAGKILIVPVTQLDISATKIREKIQRGESIRYLLPQTVVNYIGQHKLYEKH